MSLLEKSLLVASALFGGIALALLGVKMDWIQAAGLGFAVMIVGTVLNFRLLRCLGCGAWLGRYPGEYCCDCGAKIP